MKNCKLCDKEFEPYIGGQAYCSNMCKLAVKKASDREKQRQESEMWRNLDEKKKAELMELARKKIMGL